MKKERKRKSEKNSDLKILKKKARQKAKETSKPKRKESFIKKGTERPK